MSESSINDAPDSVRRGFLRLFLSSDLPSAASIYVAREEPPTTGIGKGRWIEQECESIDAASRWLDQYANHAQTYVSLARFAPGQGKKKFAVLASASIGADIDDKVMPGVTAYEKHANAMRLVDMIPVPCIVIDSGGGLQTHVLVPEGKRVEDFEDPEDGVRYVELLGRALRIFFEEKARGLFGVAVSFDRCHGAERYWRTPPGWNCKSADGAKTLTADRELWRIVTLAKPASADELAGVGVADLSFLTPYLNAAEHERDDDTKGQSDAEQLIPTSVVPFDIGLLPERLRSKWPLPEGDQSKNDFAVASTLAKGSHSPELVRAAILARRAALTNAVDRAKAERPDYVQRTVDESFARIRASSANGSSRGAGVTPDLKFRTIDELAAEAGVDVEWLIYELIAFGSLAMLVGKPKGGKSTLLFALLRKIEVGEPFAGRAVAKTSAVVLSEEGKATLVQKARRFGVTEARFLTRTDLVLCRNFAAVIARAVEEMERFRARVLVVDTYAAWAHLGPDAEKDAGAAQEAMQPLLEVAAKSYAVFVIHHSRKGKNDASEGDSVRGSSAIFGSVDTLIELRRLDPKAPNASGRALAFFSRFEETPPELYLDLQGDEFVVIERPEDAKLVEERARVLEVLTQAGAAGATRADVQLSAGIRKESVGKILSALVNHGIAERQGKGRKNDPYRFRLKADTAPGSGSPPIGREPGTESAADGRGVVPGSGNRSEPGTESSELTEA